MFSLGGRCSLRSPGRCPETGSKWLELWFWVGTQKLDSSAVLYSSGSLTGRVEPQHDLITWFLTGPKFLIPPSCNKVGQTFSKHATHIRPDPRATHASDTGGQWDFYPRVRQTGFLDGSTCKVESWTRRMPGNFASPCTRARTLHTCRCTWK